MKLEVRNASFSYGKRKVWENIHFTVEKNEVLAILGPNGAGKTTLLKSIMNILSFETGQALLDGQDMKKIPPKELWKQIAYVPQAKQGSATNVRDMIVLGRSAHIPLFGQPSDEDYTLADTIIDELGIAHFAHKNCNELSGGELQMVLIGRALIAKPKLLIMDEPESNLDYHNQLQVLEIMKKISQTTTCILNTHYPEHALRYADKALLVCKGKATFGRVEEVITEENLKEAFNIEVHIGSKMIHDEKSHYIIPMKLT
jgi:iron complex transport system ATP-binding protein